MEFKRTVQINSEEDTRAFGLELAESLKPGDVIGLIGDLGTGKTALTRYIAEGLGIKSRVNSPTFTIVKEYHEGRLPLYHFDIYRICDPEELYNIGSEDYFYGSGVSVVEWADLALTELPDTAKYIYIEYGPEEGQRIYNCTF